MRKLGVITIGQSPREDIIHEMRPYIGKDVEIIETGALDGLTYDEILDLKPKEDDYVLVTKLKDGKSVQVAEGSILPRLKLCINKLEKEGVDLIFLMCTGTFPDVLKSSKPMVYPHKILHGVIPQIDVKGKIAIVMPDKSQVDINQRIWRETGIEAFVIYGSPYEDKEEVERLIKELNNMKDIGLIVLDCMGYTENIKNEIYRSTNVPVILSRTLIARIISEILN